MIKGLIEKAEILIDALPYIREFYGKTVVVKLGGSAMTNPDIREDIAQDLTLMKYVGIHPIVVHGGGPDVSAMMERLGMEPKFHEGLRITDEKAIEVVEMVLVGKTNKEVVQRVNRAGGCAVGLSGKDGKLIRARKKECGDVDLGLVGDVVEIAPQMLKVLEESGYIPVIASLGVDDDGQTLNINADSVAGSVAAALKAEKLVLLTDAPGILQNPNDADSLISTVTLSDIDQLKKDGVISKGMLPKVDACRQALSAGVNKTHIIDGRISHSLLLEIFTKEGIGTQVISGEE